MAEMKQKMDVRTYTRYVEKGQLKDSDIQSHLKSLPDETENAVWVDVSAEDAELLDDGVEDSTEEETVEASAPAQPVVEGA